MPVRLHRRNPHPGSIDQVQDIVLTMVIVYHAYGVRLDRNAFLTFEVHGYPIPEPPHTHADHVCFFQKAVCQGGFPVVYMRNYAEIGMFSCFMLCPLIFICLAVNGSFSKSTNP
jgi:hypothetical protein